MKEKTTDSPLETVNAEKIQAFDPLDVSQFWKPFRNNTLQKNDCLPFHTEYPELLRTSEILAYLIRSYTIWEMTCGALGHPGGSFSEAEFLAVLFNYVLRFNPKDPKWPMRDVFYLSKCHAAPALYTALALHGYLPIGRLKYYGAWDSGLESHPDYLVTPGIEVSGGSLGQIPGVAVGRALAIRHNGPDQNDRMVYTLIGDGECNEGSVWEAFMAAGHYKLDNLVCIIDYNKVQAKGFLSQDMSIEPVADKLRAFNFQVFETQNGHDVAELVDVFNRMGAQRQGKPIALILNTIKGKKVRECQFNPNWHTSAPRSVEAAGMWLEELWDQDGKRLGIPKDFYVTLTQAVEIVPPVHGNPDHITERQA
ncbi:MAG: transketolase [Chloroflexi bacterium]|nr:transketolase [Chloroflexota bacterium]